MRGLVGTLCLLGASAAASTSEYKPRVLRVTQAYRPRVLRDSAFDFVAQPRQSGNGLMFGGPPPFLVNEAKEAELEVPADVVPRTDVVAHLKWKADSLVAYVDPLEEQPYYTDPTITLRTAVQRAADKREFQFGLCIFSSDRVFRRAIFFQRQSPSVVSEFAATKGVWWTMDGRLVGTKVTKCENFTTTATDELLKRRGIAHRPDRWWSAVYLGYSPSSGVLKIRKRQVVWGCAVAVYGGNPLHLHLPLNHKGVCQTTESGRMMNADTETAQERGDDFVVGRSVPHMPKRLLLREDTSTHSRLRFNFAKMVLCDDEGRACLLCSPARSMWRFLRPRTPENRASREFRCLPESFIWNLVPKFGATNKW